MKTSITSILTLLSLPILAQVTIDQSNFPAITSGTDLFSTANTIGVTPPTPGAAQTWDYTGLVEASAESQEFFDATSNLDFPEAFTYVSGQLSFQVFIQLTDMFSAVDANGYYNYGRSISDTTYSITTITGGANDVLNFPANDHIYSFEGGRVNFLNFPVTYQSSGTGTRVEPVDFNITVAAFGLSNTPGQRVRRHTETREVVGYGTLTIPLSDGTPSAPMDVLLIESNVVRVDSFYLGGSLAPTALLTAFGVTQGEETTRRTFLFYKPDFNYPLIRFAMNQQEILSIGYRPAGASVPTGISSVQSNAISIYPNPINAGEQLSIRTAKNTKTSLSVEMIDVTGRSVVFQTIAAGNTSKVSLNIPSNIAPGAYSIILRNADEIPLQTTTIMVR